VHAVVAVACLMVVVAVALSGVPRRVGVVAAVAGIATFLVAGYAWVFVMWAAVPRLEPVFSALPGVYAKAALALLLYFATPTLAALGTVRLLTRGARRARMSA
jgi:hypothetical protein